MKLKFTKEIKDKWLRALRSGRYKRATGQLFISKISNGNKTHRYCCIGVLGKIHPGLSYDDIKATEERDPYGFLNFNFNADLTDELITKNDMIGEDKDSGYSCVIPIIEELETFD